MIFSTKHNPKRAIGVVLAIVFGFFAYAPQMTYASYGDTATSSANSVAAGTFDLQLTASALWSAVTPITADQSNLHPGDELTRGVNVFNAGSHDGNYTASASTSFVTADLCSQLNLVATRTAAGGGAPTTEYSGPLTGFITVGTPFSLAASTSDHWDFNVTLPASQPETNQPVDCQVQFTINGFILPLTFGQGYSDQELLNGPANQFASGGWVVPTDNYSPIADARIQQSLPSTNFGTLTSLTLRHQPATNNSHSVMARFLLSLPATTTINSASLELFMNNAPNQNRTYGAHRMDTAWTETGVTWATSPSFETIPTDSVNSGIIDGTWLNWNVTGDVQGFTSGAFPNNGWMLTDDSATSAAAQGGFRSREFGTANLRPVLEVNFTVPAATTNHVVINEVFANVPAALGTDTNNEWVEIYNPTALPVDISGWKICDSTSCDTIPASAPIPAKGFAVIANDPSTWNTYWPQINALGAVEIALGSPIGNRLGNAGDSVILKNPSAVVIDSISYGTDTSILNPSIPAAAPGQSIARVVKGYDSDSAIDWLVSATPNPGTNPSASGSEVMRVTSDGIMVADAGVGLQHLVAEPSLPGTDDTIDETASPSLPAGEAVLPLDVNAPASGSAPFDSIASGSDSTASASQTTELVPPPPTVTPPPDPAPSDASVAVPPSDPPVPDSPPPDPASTE